MNSPTYSPDATSEQLAAARARVDAALTRFTKRYLAEVHGRVAEAIRYSVDGGGKRLRGILLTGAYEAAGGDGDASDLAAAVEVMHTYSLVHDDLPCMDDDDMRRGRASVHRAFDVATATVAGVAMVPLAGRAGFDAATALGCSENAAAAIVRELMTAAGAGGMIAGQLLDLEAETKALSVEGLERIHSAKTGALIAASAAAGGLAAGADSDAIEALRQYGRQLGLAFQIADDLLDVTASSVQLGKTAGRDAALGKSTYPALLGVPAARELARSLATQASETLRSRNLLTPLLAELTEHAVTRTS